MSDAIRTKDVDLDWMLSMIRHLKPDHEYFSESFVAMSEKRKEREEVNNDLLEAYRGAFVNHPIPPNKSKKKSSVANALLKKDEPKRPTRY